MKQDIQSYIRVLWSVVFLVPAVVFAAGQAFNVVVGKVLTVLQSFVGVLISLAVFLLVFGIFRYIGAGDDPKRLAEGGKLVMWGVISVFVMVSFWGLVHILLNTFFDASDLGSFQRDDSLWN
ncbi:MAG: hypothetical protein A3C06_02335 [Candidatus Taylorbacteria bacterium RIFCSPHIGHO2_02_FULL_46_13]|uniref:Uncharacterized protein n=1 Tax=Candidatus Taylorbacteria bacterium RIFCSPHIGHO2_02_FULL_46_13 TaxID=1802312 RepID=A0A1G2MSK1_9BACT|nr:MAG: hypothetical protein A3C06_02335 [Candidatus Taylorbacteria bacterium RIFCSPHIGHO2_02_FULL_46_13]